MPLSDNAAGSRSVLKRVFTWVLLAGMIVFWFAYFTWREAKSPVTVEESGPNFARSIFQLILGGFFMAAGVAGYVVTLASHGFTYNFSRPVWGALKAKLFLANIAVPLAFSLGLGFAISAFASPLLVSMGVAPRMANFVPVIGTVCLAQFAQLWVLIWGPLEKRIISKRLAAQGLTAAQVEGAFLIGLSDPTAGTLTRLGAIEHDIGALWITPDELIYWGDTERWSIKPGEVLEIERKVDARNSTALAGVRHVILHANLPGGQRQIRFHVEGLWTMGQKRKSMDRLGDAIEKWWRTAVAAPAVS